MTAATDTIQSRKSDPAAIERELGELWRAQAEALQAAGGADITLARILLLTLVTYAPNAADAELARQVTMTINPRQPARAIFMELLESGADGAVQAGLDAWVTLHCTRGAEGRGHICGEQITFEARPAAARSLPGAVLPLLLTNVPAFLWWQRGNPWRNPIFKDLEPAIDRLIIDSCSFESPETELVDAARSFDDPHFPALVSDLSWARLAAWRYQTAQIFDAPALRPHLDRLTEVRLTHYAGTSALAWLFAGWLASRLGWEPRAREAGALHFAGGQTIHFEAIPPAGPGMSGYFAGVHLAADDGATFQIERTSPTRTVARLSAGEFQSERVLPLPHETLVEWLGHDLGRLTRTPIYEAAVRLLARAVGAG